MALTRKSVDSTVRQTVTQADANSQTVAHPHLTRAPLLAEVPTHGFVLATYGGASYIHTRIGNTVLKVQVS